MLNRLIAKLQGKPNERQKLIELSFIKRDLDASQALGEATELAEKAKATVQTRKDESRAKELIAQEIGNFSEKDLTELETLYKRLSNQPITVNYSHNSNHAPYFNNLAAIEEKKKQIFEYHQENKGFLKGWKGWFSWFGFGKK